MSMYWICPICLGGCQLPQLLEEVHTSNLARTIHNPQGYGEGGGSGLGHWVRHHHVFMKRKQTEVCLCDSPLTMTSTRQSCAGQLDVVLSRCVGPEVSM